MRYKLLFFLFFLGHGAYFSSLSPFAAESFGDDSRWIFFAGQIVSPLGFFLTGILSDHFKRIRYLLVPSLALLLPAQWIFFSSTSFAIAMISGSLLRFLFSMSMQLLTLAALETSGENRFGSVRSYGTISFFMIQLLLFGAETWWPSLPVAKEGAALWGSIGALFHPLTAVIAMGVPIYRTSIEKYNFREAFKILHEGSVRLFFLFSFLFYANYQLVDYYVGFYFKIKFGLASVYAGWAVAVLLEVPFFYYAYRLRKSWGDNSLLWISLIAGWIRFVWLMSDAFGLALSGRITVMSQILHGIHFAGYYMGSIYRLRKSFPDHLYGTGYGAFMLFSISLGGAVGNILYGSMLNAESTISSQNQGYDMLFLIAVISQTILILCFMMLPDQKDKLALEPVR